MDIQEQQAAEKVAPLSRDEHDRFSLDLCRQVCEAVYGADAMIQERKSK